MKILVLGAGVIGITSAWYLRQAGHEVTVVDRQAAAGLETSMRNGGQISVCHAVPWASPSTPLKLLKWGFAEDAPLLFRFGLDRRLSWGLRFLYECLPHRTRENTRQIINLATYSRQKLRELRAQTGIDADFGDHGILHIYSSEQEFALAAQDAAMMQEFGVNRRVKSREEVLAIEPALREAGDRIVGGTYTEADFSGDAHKFTQGLAALCAGQGVSFLYNTSVKALIREGDAIAAAVLVDPDGRERKITADVYVTALGPYSPLLLRPLGIDLPIIPVAGYSATIPVREGDNAPHVSLTDDEFKLVYSRYPDRLRVAGTAEVSGYNLTLSPARCEALVRRARELFPHGGDFARAEFWKGLRPCEPGNAPSLIGRTRYCNLFNNSGHGTLGWTMAAGSGQAVADLISGKRPEVDYAFASGGRPYEGCTLRRRRRSASIDGKVA